PGSLTAGRPPRDSEAVDGPSTVAEGAHELRRRGHPDRARHECSFLKSELEHYCTSVPAHRYVAPPGRGQHADLDHDQLVELVVELWAEPVHERRMVAVELLDAYAHVLRPDALRLVERLLREARTWAIVDGLAGSVAGSLVERCPE